MYKDDFEQFLKDTTEDFLMVPSRKVWYSIYNNIHPDRKWPSMAVCFLILSAVLYIGVSNNNSLSDAARRASFESLADIAKNYSATKNAVIGNNAAINSKHISQYLYPDNKADNNYLRNNQDQRLMADLLNTENSSEDSYNGGSGNGELLAADLITPRKDLSSVSSAISNSDEFINSVVKNDDALKSKLVRQTAKNDPDNKSIMIVSPDKDPVLILSEPSINSTPAVAEKKRALKIAADNEKSWKEDYAFRNKPLMNKLKERASITYFITPSLGYRTVSKIRETLIPSAAPVPSSSFIAPASVLALPVNAQPVDDGKALNLEVGAVLKYALSENISIKAGIQGNYTNYTSRVIELGHPVQVQLAVNIPYNSTGSSTFSAIPGSDMLNRNSLQIAIPVGADLKIAGSNKIKWYIGTSVQPTYTFSGNAYILSADEKNYVSQSGLLRKWNLNTAIETFLSFKPSSGVTLNVGPQFRYQLLSSFKDEYNYSEKLYNIGIKIGISTRF